MVFEFVLKKNNIDPMADLMIDQSIDFGSTAAAFSGGQGDFTVELYILLHCKRKESGKFRSLFLIFNFIAFLLIAISSTTSNILYSICF